VHPGDLAGGFSNLEMTWLFYCSGAATVSSTSTDAYQLNASLPSFWQCDPDNILPMTAVSVGMEVLAENLIGEDTVRHLLQTYYGNILFIHAPFN